MDLKNIQPELRSDMRRLLLRSYTILHDESRHTTGVEARDINGHSVDAASSRAVQWCLIGAEIKAKEELDLTFFETIQVEHLMDACAAELYDMEEVAQSVDVDHEIPVCAQINDHFGHEAALSILRCSVKKLREADRA